MGYIIWCFVGLSVGMVIGLIAGHQLCLFSIRQEYNVWQNICAEVGEGRWCIKPIKSNEDGKNA